MIDSLSAFLDRWEFTSPARRDTLFEAHADFLNDDLFIGMKDRVTTAVWEDARKALDLADSMRTAANLTDNSLHRALALIAIGNVHTSGLESYHVANNAYREARLIAGRLGNARVMLQAELGQVYVLGLLGRYEEALRLGEEARRRAHALQDWLLYVQVTNNVAIVFARRCQYQEALTLYDENRGILQRYLSDHPTFATRLITLELNRAHLFWRLDRYHEALETATAVLNIPEIEQDAYRMAKAMEEIGLVTLYLGHINDAMVYFQQARAGFEDTGRSRDLADVTLYEAKCLLGLNELQQSESLCSEVIVYCESVGLEQELARTLILRAMTRRRLNKIQAARADIRWARKIFDAHRDKTGLGLAYMELANLLLQIDIVEEAGIMAVRAEELFTELGLTVSRARATLVRGDVAERCGHLQEAAEAYREVLDVARQGELPWLIHRSCYGLARVAANEGMLDRAIACIDEALEAIEKMLGGMAIDLRNNYLSCNLDVYGQGVSLALTNGQLEAAFNYAERAKSRVLFDMFHNVSSVQLSAHHPTDQQLVREINRVRRRRRILERDAAQSKIVPMDDDALVQKIHGYEMRIERLFQELQIRNAAYESTPSQQLPSLDKIQALLAPQTRIIEYLAIDETLWAFVIGPDSIEARRISPMDVVEQLLGRWRLHRNYAATLNSTELVAHIPTVRKLFGRLHATLFEPLLPLLEHVGRLYIVPHHILYYLPFSTLYDMRQQQYVIERFSLSRLPSASLLPVLADRRRLSWPNQPLVMGNSHHDRFPLAVSEATMVQETIGGEVYLEQDATRRRFLEDGPCRSLIHVAAHGIFRPDAPLFSSIYLGDGALTILDVLDADVPAGFLAVSACESGLSVVHPGDEIMGMSRACLHAGVQSLLLSLWRIDDRRTHDFMISFYNYLVLGVPPAEALMLTQREYIVSDETAHPFYWGAFFVVGDAFSPVLLESDALTRNPMQAAPRV